MNKQFIIYVSAIGATLFIFIFLLTINLIGFSVKEKCQLAQEKYNGDCTESLISYLDDGSNSFSSRNSAVWALGQLGDKRALPMLKKYYDKDSDENTKWNEALAQSEIKRAIDYMEGSPNITTFFWRFGKGIN